MSYVKTLREQLADIRAKGMVGYERAARWFLFANLLLYLASCIVASSFVGPIGYIEFLYHCCQWRTGNHG